MPSIPNDVNNYNIKYIVCLTKERDRVSTKIGHSCAPPRRTAPHEHRPARIYMRETVPFFREIDYSNKL